MLFLLYILTAIAAPVAIPEDSDVAIDRIVNCDLAVRSEDEMVGPCVM